MHQVDRNHPRSNARAVISWLGPHVVSAGRVSEDFVVDRLELVDELVVVGEKLAEDAALPGVGLFCE